MTPRCYADCPTCDGTGLVLDLRGKARPCGATVDFERELAEQQDEDQS